MPESIKIKFKDILHSNFSFTHETIHSEISITNIILTHHDSGACAHYVSDGTLDTHRKAFLSLLYNVMELTGKPAVFDKGSFPCTVEMFIPPYGREEVYATYKEAKAARKRSEKRMSKSLRESFSKAMDKMESFYSLKRRKLND